ncbi:MAG: CDGSH iron-sulfur domain-containing protein [Polyangiales bacterium]
MANDIEEVPGNKVLLRFEGKRCIHARHCVLSRPDVFVPNVEGEWLHPEHATAEEIAELAHSCPSGAITYEPLDGGAPETAPRVNLARVRENGPVAVHGDVELQSADGAQRLLRATLCRCGASANKPFCDGSHTAAGFVATGEPGAQPSTPLASRDGLLKLRPMKNGPLLVEGNLEVLSGTGRTVNRVTRAALCRCGQSANKPYCDGTHAKVGFQAE